MDDQTGAGKAQPCKTSQDKIAMVDSTGACLFTMSAWDTGEFQSLVDSSCPGGEQGTWDNERLMTTGERIWNLERRFNLAAGLTMADDTLPDRLLKEPAPSGVPEGRVSALDTMSVSYTHLTLPTKA